MDVREAQLPECVHDERVGRTDRVDVTADAVERRQVEVIGVAVRDDEDVDLGQRVDVDRAARTRDDCALLEGRCQSARRSASASEDAFSR